MFLSLSFFLFATIGGGVVKQKTHNLLPVMGSSCDEWHSAII
jgi:hypothetical protein